MPLLSIILTAALAIAQAPAAPAQPPASPSQPTATQATATTPAAAQAPAQAPAAQAPPPTETYVYQPLGRRDPFLNILNSGSEGRPALSRRGEGPSGMTLAEVSVRGILQSRGSLVAMIQGPDNKTYLVHQGDKLLDGTIKSVTPQGLIVIQEVNDPLSLVKQREVRKLLRSLEDGKE
jgi:Tfp pilus assembly protein PilP